MPVDLDDQLAALGTALLRESTPITLAELRSQPTEARPKQDDAPGATGVVDGELGPSAGRRRRWVGAAAIATAAASLVALVLVVDRGGPDGSATSVPEPGELQVDGVLGLDPTDPIAAGWTVTARAVAWGSDWEQPITRRYASDSPTPENGPALDVAVFDVDGSVAPNVSESDPTFDIDGSEARWLDLDGDAARGLAFTVDGRWVMVTGYRMTETEVVTAAEHVEWAADGFGAVVGAAGLPQGVVEQYVSGGFSEMWLLPLASTRDIPMLRWTSGERVVWLQSVPADDAFVRAQRITATTVTDVTVNGSPSFVATWEPRPGLRWMAWTGGPSSYLLAANELSSDELVAFAEALAPLTVDQWDALLADSEPADSDLVAVGVEQFPIVDDALLLGDRGTSSGTYGQTEVDGAMVAMPIVEARCCDVTISVDPRPLAVIQEVHGGGFAPTEIGGRSGLLGGTVSTVFVVDLGDGTALVVQSPSIGRSELASIVEAVTLVDRATWEARYEPEAPTLSPGAPPTTSPVATVPAVPNGRSLAEGATGDDVAALQERLTALGFDPGPADGVFGEATEQAVWAFEKLVLGVPREQATGVVTPEMWKRLQAKISIKPRRPQDDGVDHVEIYLPEQVLVVFDDDQPVLVTHVSTGMLDDAGEPAEYCETITIDTDEQGNPLDEPEQRTICGASKTPGGIFDVDRFVAGTRNGPLGSMWNPLYFNYQLAIHGAANVPLDPASHGNVRVPMHVAERLHELVPIGSWVYVWDGVTEPEDQTRESELPVFPYPAPTTQP